MEADMIYLLLLGIATASPPTTYHECEVSVGKVLSCEVTGFNGTAPAMVGDTVRECRFSVGRLFSCPKTYTGDAVLDRDGVWKTCEISMGKVLRCEATKFTGEAVLPDR